MCLPDALSAERHGHGYGLALDGPGGPMICYDGAARIGAQRVRDDAMGGAAVVWVLSVERARAISDRRASERELRGEQQQGSRRGRVALT